MNTDDFTDKRFPSVWSVVQPVIDGCWVVNIVSGVITRIQDLMRFVTTNGANDGTIMCKDSDGM